MYENHPSKPYHSGYVVYHFDMRVSCEGEISCNISHPRVREIIFKKVNPGDKVDAKWSMTIYTYEVTSIDEVDQICEEIRESIFDIISVTLDINVSNIRFFSHDVLQKKAEGFQISGTLPQLCGHIFMVTECVPIKPEQINDIKNSLLNNTSTEKNPYYNLYRYARSDDDPIVQFMILYLIMYEMFKNKDGNSSQLEVDKHIMNIAPTTPSSIAPHKESNGSSQREKLETIYTKLRNQLSHYRNVPPENTKIEIKNCLDEFRKIVLTAVRTN